MSGCLTHLWLNLVRKLGLSYFVKVFPLGDLPEQFCALFVGFLFLKLRFLSGRAFPLDSLPEQFCWSLEESSLFKALFLSQTFLVPVFSSWISV